MIITYIFLALSFLKNKRKNQKRTLLLSKTKKTRNLIYLSFTQCVSSGFLECFSGLSDFFFIFFGLVARTHGMGLNRVLWDLLYGGDNGGKFRFVCAQNYRGKKKGVYI